MAWQIDNGTRLTHIAHEKQEDGSYAYKLWGSAHVSDPDSAIPREVDGQDITIEKGEVAFNASMTLAELKNAFDLVIKAKEN